LSCEHFLIRLGYSGCHGEMSHDDDDDDDDDDDERSMTYIYIYTYIHIYSTCIAVLLLHVFTVILGNNLHRLLNLEKKQFPFGAFARVTSLPKLVKSNTPVFQILCEKVFWVCFGCPNTSLTRCLEA